MKRGEEVALGGQLTLLIKLERGGGGRGSGQTCSVSNCIPGICSFPFHLSFSYLRSDVEASLDIKKFRMERNTNIMQIRRKWLNQLKNVLIHIFKKEYYLASFAGESH